MIPNDSATAHWYAVRKLIQFHLTGLKMIIYSCIHFVTFLFDGTPWDLSNIQYVPRLKKGWETLPLMTRYYEPQLTP